MNFWLPKRISWQHIESNIFPLSPRLLSGSNLLLPINGTDPLAETKVTLQAQ